ncbi:MAG: endo-1,3-alpha-glucanase family glycosylhydrolase [bacterium]|nr:endo-1,3-alpha-glucanase family glycosylhydrolase [bacterium]
MSRSTVRFLLIALTCTLIAGATVGASADDNKQVFAIYFGWWSNDGWRDERLSDAPAELYDVRDPATAATHIERAKAAGIDGFIVAWLGIANDNITHRSLLTLLEASETRDFQIGVMVDLNERNFLETLGDLDQSLAFLVSDVITHPSYMRIDGQPAIYFWNQQRYTVGTWMNARAAYDPNYEQLWIMEGTTQSYMPTFDGMMLLDTAWAENPADVNAYWQERTLMMGGRYFLPTVIPGWDASAFAGWSPYATPPVDRGDGALLLQQWNAAAAVAESTLIVNSWNGYYYNTHIEPSLNFGSSAYDQLASLIPAWEQR